MKALIATPVAAVVLPDAQARNAKLENTILRWRAEHATVGASNIGGGRRHAILPNGRQAAEEGLTVARTTATRRSVKQTPAHGVRGGQTAMAQPSDGRAIYGRSTRLI